MSMSTSLAYNNDTHTVECWCLCWLSFSDKTSSKDTA